MGRVQHWTWGLGVAAFGLMAVGGAHAGSGSGSGGSSGAGASSSSGCGCASPTHHGKVPGVGITEPTVTVNLPALNVVTAGSSSTASSAGAVSANVSVGTQTTSGVNTQAIINSAALGGGGGGGGSWSDSGAVTTTIDTVRVETPEAPQTRRICAAFKAVERTIAVQASCLDDKAIPHPASQVSPERAVGLDYDGELYRCIAGARMQYVIADFSDQADFNHGQTFTCQKGEALYHAAGGALQCRPQKPARDCNERSLLRRYGAGIKVVKTERKNVCAEWRMETVQAAATD